MDSNDIYKEFTEIQRNYLDWNLVVSWLVGGAGGGGNWRREPFFGNQDLPNNSGFAKRLVDSVW